jgi:hypothetical protein
MRTCPPAAAPAARMDKPESYPWVGAFPGDPVWIGGQWMGTGDAHGAASGHSWVGTRAPNRGRPLRDWDNSVETIILV